jgi:hypothetical protein
MPPQWPHGEAAHRVFENDRATAAAVRTAASALGCGRCRFRSAPFD